MKKSMARRCAARSLTLGLLLSALLAAGATGQTKPKVQQQNPPETKPFRTPVMEGDTDEVIRVTSNLVVVPVSATDAKGERVQGLKVDDFSLEEEGRPQEIVQIADADQVPLDIALHFDVSSGVTKNFEFEKQAGVPQFFERRGAELVYLPRCTLHLNPLEKCRSKLKTIL